jgi:hypothetical protein
MLASVHWSYKEGENGETGPLPPKGMGGPYMRRIVVLGVVAVVMAMAMSLGALPVMAVNSGTQPPGPPTVSGSPHTEGARAFHCRSIGAKGASVTNKNGQPTRCR